MRPRDLAIVAGIGVLVTLAAVDTLRSDGGPEPVAATTAQTSTEAPPPRIGRVPAPGSIVYLDESCVLHEVDVASGQELPLPPIDTNCDLWAAPRGEHVAISAPLTRETRFLSLNRPLEGLGTAPDAGEVHWNPTGELAAGCDADGRGFLLEIRGPQRRLRGCPLAVAPNGFPVFRDPRGIRFGDQVVATDSFVTAVSFGEDSMTLVLGDRIERHAADGTTRAPLPASLSGRIPVISPDGCAALYPVGGARIRTLDVCVPGELGDIDGTAAAWAPDSEWIATAEDDEIVFHHVGRSDVTRWPVRARALAWIG